MFYFRTRPAKLVVNYTLTSPNEHSYFYASNDRDGGISLFYYLNESLTTENSRYPYRLSVDQAAPSTVCTPLMPPICIHSFLIRQHTGNRWARSKMVGVVRKTLQMIYPCFNIQLFLVKRSLWFSPCVFPLRKRHALKQEKTRVTITCDVSAIYYTFAWNWQMEHCMISP